MYKMYKFLLVSNCKAYINVMIFIIGCTVVDNVNFNYLYYNINTIK
jgi:hypothetical protein